LGLRDGAANFYSICCSGDALFWGGMAVKKKAEYQNGTLLIGNG